MDDLLREFLTETGEHLDVVDLELVRFEAEPDNEKILRNIFRLVHTIKGTCGFLGLPRLERLAHAAESLMGQFRDGMPVTTEAVTMVMATIDRLKEILAELARTGTEPDGHDNDLIEDLERLAAEGIIATKEVGTLVYQVLERPLQPGEVPLDALEEAFRNAPGPDEPSAAPQEAAPRPSETVSTLDGSSDARPSGNHSVRVNLDTLEHLMTMVSELVLTRNQLLEIARRHDDGEFKVPLQRLSHVTAELQEGVMKTRMQPIGSAWQKLPRIIRDVSSELGKSVELVMFGGETELDRQVLEVIKDPLTHMIRNSVDHGIEPPDERRLAGKPERGIIRLEASHEGGTISIEVADDGRGLDFDRIRRIARDRGLASEADVARMSEAQLAKFIFHPGFSTAKKLTSVSGRGVGMDVVKSNVELIGGVVDVRSEFGKGTTFTLKIPLTLAIVAALVVSAGKERFAIPQMAVLELVRVRRGSEHTIERISGSPVLRLRDRLLPIVPLAAMLGREIEGGQGDEGFVVVTQVGRQHFGILVDGVFHTEEIVVKPMSKKLRHLKLFAGNTILGDGAVVLILDPGGIARTVGSTETEHRPDALDDQRADDDMAETTTLLVFKAANDPAYKAVPLSLVTRLEEIEVAKVEWIGDRPLLQYRGRLMPLIGAGRDAALRDTGLQPVVVFSDGGRSMGLAVDEIVDIVDDVLHIEPVTGRADLIGSAVIGGRATEIVNVAHYMPLAYDDWRPGQDSRPHDGAPTILLVDDADFFRDMITPVLKAGGYRVVGAKTVADALAILSSGRRIDAIVSDIEMPGQSGFDLAKAVREHEEWQHLPLIMLAPFATPALLEKARQHGVSDFVGKFDRAGLMAAIHETLAELGEAA